jgi:hypothetical protein
MVFDLRGALLRKEEHETARLLDFEFRLRARTLALLADALGRDRGALVPRIAHRDDRGLLEDLAAETGLSLEALHALRADRGAEARRQLVAERGDPAPHRLA